MPQNANLSMPRNSQSDLNNVGTFTHVEISSITHRQHSWIRVENWLQRGQSIELEDWSNRLQASQQNGKKARWEYSRLFCFLCTQFFGSCKLAGQEGFEPPSPGFGVRCSSR